MITVRELGPDDWETWRDLRLAALAEAPDAFHSRLTDWLGAGEREWRDRLAAPGRYLVVEVGGRPVRVALASGATERPSPCRVQVSRMTRIVPCPRPRTAPGPR